MKTITFTSEFFKNECATSVLKALLNNEQPYGGYFRGFDECETETPYLYESYEITNYDDSITFQVEGLEIDWDCCQRHLELVKSSWTNGQNIELNLDYLNGLEGCEVKESEGGIDEGV